MENIEFKRILEYIEHHICEKVYLIEVAEETGYSPFYFSKLFSQMMGISFASYVRIRKLQYAMLELISGKNVLDVALQYGFESHEGFTRSFKELYGFLPRDVKNKNLSYKLPDYQIPQKRRDKAMDNNWNVCEEMHFLIFALLKESISEMQEGYCTKITVKILPNNYIEISDDGRGVPLTHEMTACTKRLQEIFAGQPISPLDFVNIEDFGSVNLNMVSSLCERMSVSVYRDGTKYTQDYIRGIAQHELCYNEQSDKRGMRIIMKPDEKIFGESHWSEKRIINWINEYNRENIDNIFVSSVE